MLKEAIKKLQDKQDLEPEEMKAVFTQIMEGTPEKEDVKAFLKALAEKGETPPEIAAAAAVMRQKAKKVVTHSPDIMDTCGTGGARINDINVSTISAILLAACGQKVAKHGNRSFTGKCGSADLLEELGIRIDCAAEEVALSIEKYGFGFMFAPNFHPAMKNVMQARKELASRTIFNILGPLCNPAGVRMQVLGVYKAELTEVMAEALDRLGSEKAFIVHGLDGLDEISTHGRTKLTQLEAGRISTRYITPSDFGLMESGLQAVTGSSREYNAGIALDILSGNKIAAGRDIVLMNAAAALALAGKAADFKAGITITSACLSSGAAMKKLEQLRRPGPR